MTALQNRQPPAHVPTRMRPRGRGPVVCVSRHPRDSARDRRRRCAQSGWVGFHFVASNHHGDRGSRAPRRAENCVPRSARIRRRRRRRRQSRQLADTARHRTSTRCGDAAYASTRRDRGGRGTAGACRERAGGSARCALARLGRFGAKRPSGRRRLFWSVARTRNRRRRWASHGTGIGSGDGPGIGPGSGGGIGGGTYRVGNGVTAPRLLAQTTPRYTADALLRRVQGTVSLDVVVARDGTPANIRTSDRSTAISIAKRLTRLISGASSRAPRRSPRRCRSRRHDRLLDSAGSAAAVLAAVAGPAFRTSARRSSFAPAPSARRLA
jgi:hypothetical protein